MDKLTSFLVSWGLDTPVKRGVLGFVLGSGFDTIVQPSWAYTPDGVRRNTYYASQDKDSLITSTYLPAGSTGILLAIALGIFL